MPNTVRSKRRQRRALIAVPATAVLVAAIVLAAGPIGTRTPDAPGRSSAAGAPVARTTEGAVRGANTATTSTFQGIPYAAAPVGRLRWHAPEPPAAWAGVRDATRPGSACPQGEGVGGGGGSLDEDCLLLNVTTPRSDRPVTGRPVLVWVHGDGATGAGSLFDPSRLVGSQGVVVVTVNYRLGIFAGFGLPGLRGSGTFGLQDQQAALRWVQRNIAGFGGNPHNVTLFGESYGALSVTGQLTSPGSRGLFQRAVLQSGFGLADIPAGGWFAGLPAVPSAGWRSRAELDQLGAGTAAKLGCRNPALAVACMRGKPVRELLAHTQTFLNNAYGTEALPEDPATALRRGHFHRVPVISGGTRDEGRLFVALFHELAGQPVTRAGYGKLVRTAFGRHAPAVLAQYPPGRDDASAKLAWAAVVTDRVWALRTMQQNRLFAARMPTYGYEFADRGAPVNVPFPAGMPAGAYHSAEVQYQFDIAGTPSELTGTQRRLAERMNAYWANFARTGDPNGPGLPRWQPFRNGANPPTVLAMRPQGDGPVDYAAEHRLRFWASITG